MKIKFSTVGYVAAAVLAANASCDLAAEVGATYHVGTLAKASLGLALFAGLTGAMWTTIARVLASLASERRYSWATSIAKFLSFVVGYGCIFLFAWGASTDGTTFWISAIEFIGAFLGIGTFVCISLLATDHTTEEVSTA